METPSKEGPRLGGARAWHLVGHSTGGVDAALLLRDAPVVRGDSGSTYATSGWNQWSDLVARVSSVTTIAAPHFGTALAESPLARFADGSPSLGALTDAAGATIALMRRGDIESRIGFALSAMPKLTQTPLFLAEMLFKNELARDLRPNVMGALSARPVRPNAQGRVLSVATIAPRPSAGHSDKLFRDMWRWTHDAASRPMMQPVPHPLNNIALRLPSQHAIDIPQIDPGDNDGVVSTQRQILGDPIALVVGDHVDVLGRYRRASLIDDKVIDPGLLTSGANFGDDEFFGLIDRLAQRMAPLILQP